MALTPDSLNATLWLAEPTRLRIAAARVLAHRTCPTSRELVEERRKRLEVASRPLILAGGDGFHPAEKAQAKPLRSVKGGVGVIPILGPIQQRLTPELLKSGGTSVEEIAAGLDALLANKAVEAIVFDVDSQGGDVSGIMELADKIMSARREKKTYAVSNALAASAALWLSTAAEQFFVTPSGYAGSVGVYLMHVDESKALDEEGIKVSLVSAGKHKVEGNPFEPLGEETRAYLQSQVDMTYSKFVSALSVQRDVGIDRVRKDFGQGRLLNAEDAVAAGMADRVLSMSDLLDRLTGRGAAKGPGTSADILRLRHQHEQARTA